MSAPGERARAAGVRSRWTAQPDFPLADEQVARLEPPRSPGAVDIVFANPPAPDGGIWIRSQHRVGRRSREGMIWPQVSLAQMAALFPDRSVEVVDAIPLRMAWEAFERLLREKRPRYYVTQVTAPTLQNDMYGVFLAKSLGATTITFGTHVTPVPRSTMRAYPALDYVLRGEPELTLRELVDTLDRAEETEQLAAGRVPPPRAAMRVADAERFQRLFAESDPGWSPAWRVLEGDTCGLDDALGAIKGLVWRRGRTVVVNADRPFIANLDDLPLPLHDLLPLDKYRAPLVRGPYGFVVSARGCPGGCRFCIKHVSYGRSVRFRSPDSVLQEIEQLVLLGVHDIHMYADLFTVDRDNVVGICEGILARRLPIRWTCNSRVDYVDEDLLRLMKRAGCWLISWGIESGDDRMLQRMRKGISLEQVRQTLQWSRAAGIWNWGYFVIGLPGETEESIRATIRFSKELPLDLALFHIAAPHPGTPFFYEVVDNNWFRTSCRWEDVDMDRSTVLDYPTLRAEDLVRWSRRAFREWALRPGPLVTYLKMLWASPSLLGATVEVGLESIGWARSS